MSCCTVKVNKNVNTEYIREIQKYVKNVDICTEDDFSRITLWDKSTPFNTVWIEVKVRRGGKEKHSMRSDAEYINGALKELSLWIELLVKPREFQQKSLFDDGVELLTLPEPPRGESGWGGFYKKEKAVKIENIKRQYGFFEVYKDFSTWYHLDNQLWESGLPTNEELIEIAKSHISGLVGVEEHRDNTGSFPVDWIKDAALSDYELTERMRISMRIYLLPQKSKAHFMIDNGLTLHKIDERISYRYYTNGKSVSGGSWEDTSHLKYNIFTPDFLSWVRDKFNVATAPMLDDQHVLEESIKNFLTRSYYDYMEDMKGKSRSEFIASAEKSLISGNCAGGTGYGKDGYRSSNRYSVKKRVIEIRQSRELRLQLGRDVENFKVCDFDEDSLVIHSLDFKDVVGYAYDNFREDFNSKSLFDFAA